VGLGSEPLDFAVVLTYVTEGGTQGWMQREVAEWLQYFRAKTSAYPNIMTVFSRESLGALHDPMYVAIANKIPLLALLDRQTT
jgi:predicted patatin/cPLA2 family phospholipase